MKRILALLVVLVVVSGGLFLLQRREHRPPSAVASASASAMPSVIEPRIEGVRAPEEARPPMRGGAELAGHVKDVAGGPIARAKIVVTRDAGGVATTVTDEAGAFHVAATPGGVTVRASADGYASAQDPLHAPDRHAEILLTPESVLAGRVVVAGSDTPVGSANVSVGEGDERVATTSDADGRFRLRGLEPGRYTPIATTPTGWGTTRESVLLGLAETEEVVIALHPARAVRGRVVGPDGKGCAKATVLLVSRANADERAAHADEDGAVRFDGILPGAFVPTVSCKGMAPAAKYPDVVVKDEELAPITWKVERGFALDGVVVTAEGKPVPYARVFIQGEGARTVNAGEDGAFHAGGLRGGSYELEAASEDAAPTPAVPVVVDRDLEGVKVVMQASGAVEGTVVDPSGAPAAGASVAVRGAHRRLGGRRVPVQPDGTFTLPNVAPGDVHLVAYLGESALETPGADGGLGKLVAVKAGATAKVRLVVESQNGEIRGRVVDDAGNPVVDAFVHAERESDDPGQRGRGRAALAWDWHGTAPVLTDNDGAFVLRGLPSGSYGVRAYRKGGGDVTREGVKTGSSVTLAILRTGSLAGTVVDANGKAPDTFTITVRDVKRLFNRTESFFRTDGAFTVRDLPAGEFAVSAATAAGRALTEVALEQGESKSGVALTVERSGAITGRLVALDDGAPVAGVFVVPFPAKGGAPRGMAAEEEKLVSDGDGRFHVENVAPGPTRIVTFPKSAASEAFASAMVRVDVPPGGTVELPPVKVARDRLRGGIEGDLCFTTDEGSYGQDPTAVVHGKVLAVRPGSSAAKAGLVVGDEIVSVDGHSIEGDDGYLYEPLVTVPPGTKLVLGLRRGVTITVVAAAPARR